MSLTMKYLNFSLVCSVNWQVYSLYVEQCMQILYNNFVCFLYERWQYI